MGFFKEGIGGGAGGGASAEVGTFTPHLVDNTLSTSEGQTYSKQIGKYVKIDKLVLIEIEIILTSLGTLTGTDSAHILDLPFSLDATHRCGFKVTFASGLAIPAGSYITTSTAVGTTHTTLRVWSAAGGPIPGTISHLTNSSRIELSGSYIAA